MKRSESWTYLGYGALLLAALHLVTCLVGAIMVPWLDLVRYLLIIGLVAYLASCWVDPKGQRRPA